MKLKVIIATLIFIIILSIYLLFYPLQFDFYEQSKARRMVDLTFIPLLLVILIFVIARKMRASGTRWKVLFKESLFVLALFGLFYIGIARSILSCGILFVNCNLPKDDLVEVQGIVTEIVRVQRSGPAMPKYEITVIQNGKEFNFESNKNAIEKYSVNDKFSMKMKSGILNILYK